MHMHKENGAEKCACASYIYYKTWDASSPLLKISTRVMLWPMTFIVPHFVGVVLIARSYTHNIVPYVHTYVYLTASGQWITWVLTIVHECTCMYVNRATFSPICHSFLTFTCYVSFTLQYFMSPPKKIEYTNKFLTYIFHPLPWVPVT